MQATYQPIFKLITIVALVLSVTVSIPAHAGLGETISSAFSSGRTMIIEHDTPTGKLKMRIVGAIYFTATEDDVAKLNDRAVIEETRGGIKRRVEFKSDNAGGVKRLYRLNGREVPFDAEAKRWLASTIPTLFREAGIDVERRVKRIHAAGGTEAILAEIEHIESNHSRGKYVTELANLSPLDEKRLHQLIDAAEKLNGDFERKKALHAIMNHQALSAPGQIAILNIVAKMDSDFEQRSVLEAMTPKLVDDAKVTAAWRDAIDKIDSDFDVRSIVESLSKLSKPSSTQVDMAIHATLALDSDFEHAVALKSIVKHLNAHPAHAAAWLASAQKLQTAHEKREVLTAIVNQIKLDKSAYNIVFTAIDDTEGDFEKRSVLEAMAKRMPRDNELVARYRKTAANLSEHERGLAERAISAALKQ